MVSVDVQNTHTPCCKRGQPVEEYAPVLQDVHVAAVEPDVGCEEGVGVKINRNLGETVDDAIPLPGYGSYYLVLAIRTGCAGGRYRR